MASTGENYGLFWNSNNGDRTYDAESFESWLKKFFTTGVFEGDLQVTATSGMTVQVGSGYTNVNGKVRFWNTTNNFTLDAANSTYPRIDTIVITRDEPNREIKLEVVKGQLSGNTPQPTAPVRTGGIYQLVLAQIYVEAGVTEITGGDITDKRTDTDLCGYITGTVTEMDFSQFSAQFASYYQQFVENNEADFVDWFEHLQYILDGDVAGHLQNEIEALDARVDTVESKLGILTATLATNQTSITFTDSRITTNTIFSFYTSIYGVSPTAVSVANGSVTLTFVAQGSSMIVGVRLDG